MRQNLDLETALRAIEFKPHPTEPGRWVKGRHVVTLRGGIFYDTLTGRGGRSATDLFMAVEEIDLMTAARATSKLMLDEDPHLGEYIAMHREAHLHLPLRDEAVWPAVRKDLMKCFGIFGKTLDDLHRRKQIYCTSSGDLVAIARDRRGHPVGAEQSGSGDRSTKWVLGSDFTKGAFYANAPNQPEPRRAVLTANALEALAWASMFPDDIAISLASSMTIGQCDNLSSRLKARGLKIHSCLPATKAWDQVRVRLGRDYGVMPIEPSSLFKGARDVLQAVAGAAGLNVRQYQPEQRVDKEHSPVCD